MGPVEVSCPTCGRRIIWSPEAPYRPFCSERCRLIDLGAWLTERRGIPDETPAEPPAEEPPSDDPASRNSSGDG